MILYLIKHTKIVFHSKGINNNLSAISHAKIGDIHAQAPKFVTGTDNLTSENTDTMQPRDVTAEDSLVNLRTRRPHSSNNNGLKKPKITKGASRISSTPTKGVSDSEKVSGKPKSFKTGRPLTLSTLIKKEVNKHLQLNGKFNGIINIISDPKFLMACYEEIKGKTGNMTPGSDQMTLDGLNIEWFLNLAEKLKSAKFKFQPARRVMIPKPGKKELRPLGVSSPRDKIVQKALQTVMEAIWETIFLDSSYGFRPNRSCHSALKQLYMRGGNYTWVIQGDISSCFDQIPHSIIMKRVSKIITCQRTLELIQKSLQAGYIDPYTKEVKRMEMGTPQGSVLSPLLCNIVLHELDLFMSKLKANFDTGKTRAQNRQYARILMKRSKSNDPFLRRKLLLKLRNLHKVEQMDPNFKRLYYVRYADDFVILIIGSKDQTKHIRLMVKDFLFKSCGLELNIDKTVISHIQKEGFEFLGAKCSKADMLKNHIIKVKGISKSRRVNTRLRVFAPIQRLIEKLIINKFAKYSASKTVLATGRKDLVNLEHEEILTFYNHKIRGILNYYSFAGNLSKLHRIVWILQESCALTLALKFKLRTKRQIFKKFGKLLTHKESGKSLYKPSNLITTHTYNLSNPVLHEVDKLLKTSWAGKLTKSALFKNCVICDTTSNIEMHHIRAVSDVRAKIRKK
jgi:group II intron reverse transcriptase/maturase